MASNAVIRAEAVIEEQREDWVASLLVEAVGTFTLVFIGVSAITMTNNDNLVAIALAHGLAIGLMVAATGHISGGAFNPAVTVALLIARKVSALKCLLYIVAQLAGAALGALLVTAVFPAAMTSTVQLGVPTVGAGFSTANAFIAEIATTFLLAYVIFGVAIDKRGPSVIASLAIGLAVTMAILATGRVSGTAMNPARWLGPALVGGYWSNGWIWIAAPLVGAVLAAVVYFYLYLRGERGA